MPLINDVKTLCDRLGPRGWRDLLKTVSGGQLDIVQSSAAALATELTKVMNPALFKLSNPPSKTGFEDFSKGGLQAVTGGSPAKSLLYHALANPDVHPTPNNTPSTNANDYATLEELDLLENFIFSLVANRTDLANTFIAVFAYQYRPGSRSTHRVHADMAYSRTGVARVGTAAANYDASRRSFWVLPADGTDAIAVLPARYGVFLARKRRPGAFGSVQGGGANVNYIFPVHKLFDGKECLKDKTIAITFREFHRNEKLRKTHSLSVTNGGLPIPPGFDITKLPYVRDSDNGGNLVTLRKAGSSVLVVPVENPTLSRTVSQKTADGTTKIVHFQVPAEDPDLRDRGTRFTQSTLQIPFFDSPTEPGEADRLAPEYVNIRHEVDPTKPPTQQPVPLGGATPAVFSQKLKDGGYFAAHFVDDSCDGCVTASVTGIAASLDEDRPAFSLVTAPDFFPLADQIELEAFGGIARVEPLSDGQLPVNPSLPMPGDPSRRAFHHRDQRITAVVGGSAMGVGTPAPIVGTPNRAISFLPDAASNVFAPGWDVSRSRDSLGPILTSSGLGSPFPEDAKLCAALSSFWPAAAPDASRTFGNGWPNQLPMLDDELGFHPNHERVRSGVVTSYRGWDGEFGPFFEKVSGTLNVNFASIERSDYVTNTLNKQIRVSLTANVQSEDLIARRLALNACLRILGGPNEPSCLVVVRKVDDWSVAGAAMPQVIGSGFLFEFANFDGGPRPVAADLTRKRAKVSERLTFQICDAGVAVKRGSAAFRFIPQP